MVSMIDSLNQLNDHDGRHEPSSFHALRFERGPQFDEGPCSSLQVNHKLEQCAEDCIAKLLKSLAVRNQDRSSRPWAAADPYRAGDAWHADLVKQC